MTNRGRTHSRSEATSRSTGNPRTEHNGARRGEARDTYYYCSHRGVGRVRLVAALLPWPDRKRTRRQCYPRSRYRTLRVPREHRAAASSTGKSGSAEEKERQPVPLAAALSLPSSLDPSDGRNEADDGAERSGTERSGVPLGTAVSSLLRRRRRRR